MRKTKIICTIGPASDTPAVIEKMILAGMDIARINFSHASFEQFTKIKKIIDAVNGKYGTNVKILIDLQGPRIRVGNLPEEGIELTEKNTYTFTTDEKDKNAIHINDPYLHEDIKVSHPLYLANGDLELSVLEKNGSQIIAKVIRGGRLHARKGVNVPQTV